MTESAIPATIDPSASYEVTLSRPVIYGGRQHSPSSRVIITGAAWPIFKDAITAAKKLPTGEEGKL